LSNALAPDFAPYHLLPCKLVLNPCSRPPPRSVKSFPSFLHVQLLEPPSMTQSIWISFSLPPFGLWIAFSSSFLGEVLCSPFKLPNRFFSPCFSWAALYKGPCLAPSLSYIGFPGLSIIYLLPNPLLFFFDEKLILSSQYMHFPILEPPFPILFPLFLSLHFF